MRHVLLVLIAAVALSGCGADPAREADEPGGTPLAGRCDPALDQGFRAWAAAGFSGSIAISTRGEVDCAVAYGTADKATGAVNTPGSVFSIGSITKAFTAAAILDLADAGKLSLDDRAGELLPGLRGPAARSTVEQLLLHTSGLKGSHGADHEPLTARQAIAAIGELEQAFRSGRDFLYSNAGYTLLALIVERASGTTFRRYLESHILRLPGGRMAGGFWDGRPAAPGPRSTGYLEDGTAGEPGGFAGPHWAVEGNGGLAMTVPELATWTHALFTGQIVSPTAVEALETPGVRAGPGRSETPGWVAYDESVYGQSVLASAGGGGDIGHNAIVAWLPASERVIAVASNTADISAEQLLAAVGPALLEGGPLPEPERSRREADPSELRSAAGAYALPSGDRFEVVVRGNRLAVTAEGPQAVEALFPLPEGVSPEDVAAHERSVRALLAGDSGEGRKERDALESSLGPIDGLTLDGSVVEGGELRTYVTASSGARSMRLWYALNEAGAVEAAQGPADPPTALLVKAGRDSFRRDDPTGASPPVSVTFPGRRMTVAWPGGQVSAHRR